MSSDRNNSLLEEIFKHSPSFIAVLNGPEFVFEMANEKYYEVVGHRDIIGKPLLEALPEIKGQGFFEILTNVLVSGEKFVSNEVSVDLQRTPNGPFEKRYVDLIYQRIPDQNGKPNNIFAHGVDVTEKVQARKKLEESETGFKDFANAMPHMAFIADPDGNIIFYNQRWYEFIQGMEGTEGWGWKDQPIHHPDDLQRTIEVWSHSLKTGEPYNVAYRLRRHDGVYRWHSGRAVAIKDSEGNIVKWIGTNTDIHDYMTALEKLSESESKFKTIADAMPQMVWSTLPDGYHDYYNDRWYEFTGVPHGSTDGEAWNDMFHPDDQERAWKTWHHSLETGEPYRIEYRLKFRDGTYRWTLGRALPIRNTKGDIIRWMGTCTDIHEIKEHENQLKDIQKELEISLVARDEFLSVASHELKTPLTALKLQTQSMRRNFQKGRTEAFSMERVGDLVNMTEKQIGRLVRLVDDMLDLTRIQSGKLTFKFEKTNLSELVKEMLERMDEQMSNAGCVVSSNLEDNLVGSLDRSRMEQVVLNLMTNAMKYGKGQPVNVSLKRVDKTFILSIKDHGIGISKEHQDLIFHRFERAIDSNEISGLGLGLYITGQIVEGHNGKIWVESEEKKGSTFHVEIPVV